MIHIVPSLSGIDVKINASIVTKYRWKIRGFVDVGPTNSARGTDNWIYSESPAGIRAFPRQIQYFIVFLKRNGNCCNIYFKLLLRVFYFKLAIVCQVYNLYQ